MLGGLFRTGQASTLQYRLQPLSDANMVLQPVLVTGRNYTAHTHTAIDRGYNMSSEGNKEKKGDDFS